MAKFIFHQHIVGEKGSLDQSRARKTAREIAVLMENSGPNFGIAFYLEGYNDTDLELWDIPEACQYLVWLNEDLTRRQIDFTRLMPESRRLLQGCVARYQGRQVILREQTRAESLRDFQTWERQLRRKVH